MKGPYERLKWDLRRVWECPACHHRERTSGAVVTKLCRCQEKIQGRGWMKLIETDARRSERGKKDPEKNVQADAAPA